MRRSFRSTHAMRKSFKSMRASEQQRPHLRRLGDQLGAILYAVGGCNCDRRMGNKRRTNQVLSGLSRRHSMSIVNCDSRGDHRPISLAARRGIIIKNPAALENISKCRTAIFDKTGTLTYGRPKLTEVVANRRV